MGGLVEMYPFRGKAHSRNALTDPTTNLLVRRLTT